MSIITNMDQKRNWHSLTYIQIKFRKFFIFYSHYIMRHFI